MQTKEALLSNLLKASWSKGVSYPEYRRLVEKLAGEGKSTGTIQSEAYINYTLLNDRRMKRWDKTLKFSEASLNTLISFPSKVNWLVLTESWCGDASPALPVMHKMCELNPNISLRIILRDEHPELMQRFLTNGAMSIPKLIQLGPGNQRVLGTWGPRSTKATQLVDAFKKENGALTAEFRESLQIWYNKDGGQGILQDLLNLLSLE